MSLDLNKLKNKLDNALSNETSETLNKFLKDKRMKPFNLEEALAGKPVVCRNGWEVTEIVYMPTVTGRLKVFAVAHGVVRAYDREGNFSTFTDTHELDLFMLEEKKSLWINLYNNEGDLFVTAYKTEVEAKDRGLSTLEFEYIKTIEITNEIEL
jgi:hypothetical protein